MHPSMSSPQLFEQAFPSCTIEIVPLRYSPGGSSLWTRKSETLRQLLSPLACRRSPGLVRTQLNSEYRMHGDSENGADLARAHAFYVDALVRNRRSPHLIVAGSPRAIKQCRLRKRISPLRLWAEEKTKRKIASSLPKSIPLPDVMIPYGKPRDESTAASKYALSQGGIAPGRDQGLNSRRINKIYENMLRTLGHERASRMSRAYFGRLRDEAEFLAAEQAAEQRRHEEREKARVILSTCWDEERSRSRRRPRQARFLSPDERKRASMNYGRCWYLSPSPKARAQGGFRLPEHERKAAL